MIGVNAQERCSLFAGLFVFQRLRMDATQSKARKRRSLLRGARIYRLIYEVAEARWKVGKRHRPERSPQGIGFGGLCDLGRCMQQDSVVGGVL